MKGGYMKNKKGLSNIIATVLIVLLALVAVGLVWSFIRPTIEGAGTSIGLTQQCLDVEVRPTGCDAATGVVQVQLVKGNPTQVIGIVEDTVTGVTSTAAVNAPEVLATIPTDTGIPDGTGPWIASAAAIVTDPEDSTKTATCDISFVKIDCT